MILPFKAQLKSVGNPNMHAQWPHSSTNDGHLDVLGSLPPDCRGAILAQCTKKKYRKGQIIWSQGHDAGDVAFLVEGTVISTYHSSKGRAGVTGIWFPGDILGAANLGVSWEQQLTVRCLQNALIYVMSTERFFDIVRRFPEFSQSVIRALSVRLRWLAHLALTLGTQTVTGRVCSVLLVLVQRLSKADKDGLMIDLNLTQEDLAAVVGVSRQFMNMTLHDLKQKGLIKLKGRKIVILDKSKMEALAYSS